MSGFSTRNNYFVMMTLKTQILIILPWKVVAPERFRVYDVAQSLQLLMKILCGCNYFAR